MRASSPWASRIPASFVLAFALSGPSSAQVVDDAGLAKAWNISKPLHICTASIQDFGARCNGNAGVPLFDQEVFPIGSVPAQGWCAAGENFCGYDIDVWRRITELLELQEGRDYEHVCLGENGFGYMIDNLARANTTLPTHCDIGVSSITASVEREDMGIQFSRTTHRSALAVLVFAPLKQRGIWAFFEPLHVYVWMSLVFTVIVTPFFVFFFESVFSKRSAYTSEGGRLHILHGVTESLWHSISHTLSIDVFKVHAIPSRLITAAYAFLVLILTNTYTANLAAFLTVDQLDTQISDIVDLRGKAVVTVNPYIDRLYKNHRIVATNKEGWDYDTMIERLKSKVYAAVISDDTQLITRAYRDESCSLHILPESVEPFDLALAFSKDFALKDLQESISSAILNLQEGGVLEEIKSDHQPPPPSCLGSTEFSETNQVPIRSLWGLWVILAAAIGLAAIAGFIEYELKRRGSSEKVVQIQERADVFKRALTKSVSFGQRGGGGSIRGLGVHSKRCSIDENDDIFARSSRSLHDGIVPVACLEVVTESQEEHSPKGGMLKHGLDTSRGGYVSDIKPASDSGIVSDRRRSQARAEAAAAAAAAAIASEKAEEAAAEAAAAEASGTASSRHRSQARTSAAAAAAAAAIAAEEASSASRAAVSARDSGTARDRGATLGLQQSSTYSVHDTPSPTPPTRTLPTTPHHTPIDIELDMPPGSNESTLGDTPGMTLNTRLPPPLPLRNLPPQHPTAMQQRSFGRSISTASSFGRTATPGHEGDTTSSLFNNNLQGEDTEGGMPWRSQPGPTSLAVSVAPSGTESAGDFTRGSVCISDCVRCDFHNGNAGGALSPTNSPQSPVEGALEGSREAGGFEGFESPAVGVMGMAMQRLPRGGIDGVLGGVAAESPSHQRSGHLRADENITLNAMVLQMASMRSDGSQLLGMPPSVMGGAPVGMGDNTVATRVDGTRGVSRGVSLSPSTSRNDLGGVEGGTDIDQAGAAVLRMHEHDDARNVTTPAATLGMSAADLDSSAASGSQRVATGGALMNQNSSRVGDWDKHGDIDAELAQLSELVQTVAIRVNKLMRQRQTFRES